MENLFLQKVKVALSFFFEGGGGGGVITKNL